MKGFFPPNFSHMAHYLYFVLNLRVWKWVEKEFSEKSPGSLIPEKPRFQSPLSKVIGDLTQNGRSDS